MQSPASPHPQTALVLALLSSQRFPPLPCSQCWGCQELSLGCISSPGLQAVSSHPDLHPPSPCPSLRPHLALPGTSVAQGSVTSAACALSAPQRPDPGSLSSAPCHALLGDCCLRSKPPGCGVPGTHRMWLTALGGHVDSRRQDSWAQLCSAHTVVARPASGPFQCLPFSLGTPSGSLGPAWPPPACRTPPLTSHTAVCDPRG